MNRILLLIAIFLSVGIFSMAQSNLNPSFNSPVPPSPEVSALQKFGSIPVGPSTGIPSINIPIYQYQDKVSGLEMSVSLSYHAGGVRVDEVSSSVGLGWSLNAGGVVSRVIKGIPDECSDGFLNVASFDPSTGNDPVLDAAFKPFVKAADRRLDLEADIFSYTIGGKSGKFTYGRNGQILMIDDQKVKIEKTVSLVGTGPNSEPMITKFVITDETGTQYFFESYEITSMIAAFHPDFTSAWYLTKVLAPSQKDYIILTYDDVQILSYITAISETSKGDIYPNTSSTTGDQIDQTASRQSLSGKRISSINFPNGVTVQFLQDSALRTDLPNDRLLKKVLVTDNIHTVRGVKLTQSYALNGRATLESVIPFSGSSPEITESPYLFSYEAGLPARLSNRQDHWGYPISHELSDPTRRIPHEIFGNAIGGKYELNGVNRDTDPDGVKAGTLYKIVYPTGGWTEFEYEPNTANDGWLNRNFSVLVNDPVYNNRVENFYLSKDQGGATTIDGSFVFNGEPDGPTNFTLKLQPTSASGGSGTQLLRVQVFPPAGYSSGPLIAVDFNTPTQNMGSTQTFSLQNLVKGSTYYLRFYFTNIDYFYGNAQLSWKERNAQTSHTVEYSHVQPYVGGLRVKAIRDYDGIHPAPASQKFYDYLAENGQSSGVLATYPTYTYTNFYSSTTHLGMSGGYGVYTASPPLALIRQSSSINDIAYINGSPVTYSRVVERFENGSVPNGRIERYFTTHPAGSATPFPFTPAPDLFWSYGLLNKEMIYDKDNRLVQQTDNNYAIKVFPNYGTTDEINNFVSYSIAPVMFLVPDEVAASENPNSYKVSNFEPIWFLYNDYFPYAGRQDLLSTTKTYFDGKGQSLAETTTNEFDPNYYYLKKKQYTNSKNEVVSELYRYPADKVAAGITIPYQQMVERNMINFPVETERQINGVRKQVLVTNFAASWPNNASLILPATIASQVRSEPAENRVHYYSYDEKGNPLSAGQESGMKICYIWSYNRKSVICEIKNADYATVEIVLGGAAAINAMSNQINPSDESIKSFLAPLRTDSRLSGALVTSYTYIPLWGVTSQTDPSGKSTYYEYDGFGRLLRIRDRDLNILKSFEYKYQVSSGCGSNCYVMSMQNFAGNSTIGYPVGVFNVQGKLLGNATNASEYVNKWNNDPVDAAIGALSTGTDALHFILTLNSGKTLPAGVTGCRYYQIDLLWRDIDGVRNKNAAYIDFGDGSGMRMGIGHATIPPVVAPNTVYKVTYEGNLDSWASQAYFKHSYPNDSSKTLTFYHNDAMEFPDFDNVFGDADGESKLRNLRGNLPINTPQVGGSSYQDASMSSIALITNWNDIHGITNFRINNGDAKHPWLNMSFPQDFMAGNPDLAYILTCRSSRYPGFYDPNFKISRLKSDWNTYFTKLHYIRIHDDHWNHEDLSALKKLEQFTLYANTQDHMGSLSPTGSPWVAIPGAVIDNILKQIAAGAGQSVINGVILINSAGGNRSSDSDGAVQFLLSRGWSITINTDAIPPA